MTPDKAELLNLATMCSTKAHFALADRKPSEAAKWMEAAHEILRQLDELSDESAGA